MGRLIYSLSVSLDGFAAGPGGSLEFVHVDEELHEAFNEEARSVRAFLYGRRMYELMVAYWPTGADDPDATPAMRDFAAIWAAMPKLVFSRSLPEAGFGCRLVREDAATVVAAMKAEAGDLGVGGPTLAGSLLRAGLVDEVRLYVNPVVLGSGLPCFPPLDAPLALRPFRTHRFGSGVVLLSATVEGRPGA